MLTIGDFERLGQISPRMLRQEHLRGMLRWRQAQIEQTLGEEEARLRRVEAHIRALEGSTTMVQDIVTRAPQPMRIVEATGTAPGFGSENLGPLFMRLVPEVITQLEATGARP